MTRKVVVKSGLRQQEWKNRVHCSLVCCSRWDKVPSNDRLQGKERPDPSTGLSAAAGARQRPSSCHEKWVDDSRGSDGMDQANPGQGRLPLIVGAGLLPGSSHPRSEGRSPRAQRGHGVHSWRLHRTRPTSGS